MFSLDFEKIHHYLFPRDYDEHTGLPMAGQGKPAVPILNPESPRSGIHICRETIFTSGSLAFICYAKNLFPFADQPHPPKPTGVKVCLKLTAGVRKGRGSYGSPSVQGETISFECTASDMVGIWRVLRGLIPSYSIYLPLPGQQPKSFDVKYQPQASDSFYAEVREGTTTIRIPFDEGPAFSLQAVIVAVVRTLYPHLDGSGAIHMLDCRPPQGSGREASQIDTDADKNDEAASGDAFEPDLRAEGDEDIGPGLRKAVYAICLKTWPAQRKDVAQYVQKHAGRRAAQRIVDAANRGEFEELDNLAAYLDRHD